ncbi:hypothetical protein CI102_12270 [Trichoderma harzianum]|nr:hypothetical protein CI102_12270 [Trichoderma harzianum]
MSVAVALSVFCRCMHRVAETEAHRECFSLFFFFSFLSCFSSFAEKLSFLFLFSWPFSGSVLSRCFLWNLAVSYFTIFFSLVFNVRRWMRAVLCTVSCLRLSGSKDVLVFVEFYKLNVRSKLWSGSRKRANL